VLRRMAVEPWQGQSKGRTHLHPVNMPLLVRGIGTVFVKMSRRLHLFQCRKLKAHLFQQSHPDIILSLAALFSVLCIFSAYIGRVFTFLFRAPVRLSR